MRTRSNLLRSVLLLGILAAGTSQRVSAQPPPEGSPPSDPVVLTVEQAVAWAVHFNPDLAVVRKQRGIAAANVIIARTYPFNPIWFNLTLGANGPESAGVTNKLFQENYARLDLEVCGQGKIRRAAAAAGVSRTEWEIAAQELNVSVRAVRAFNTYIYRQEKLHLLADTIRLQEQTVSDVRKLVDQNKLKPTDRLLAEADLVEARGQQGPNRAFVVAAWNELRRTMGVDTAVASCRGQLEPGVAPAAFAEALPEAEVLTRVALHTRPDLQALQMAVQEAEQRVRLEVANRWGNPSIGPAMEYNETRATFVGAVLQMPVPVLNIRRGEIQLRQAERDRALADSRRVEIQIALDIRAALERVNEAQRWVAYFGTDALPALQKTMDAFEKLFAAGEPSVDVLRLIDARRRLQRARDSYLDALWELSQGRVDLAVAVGDLSLVVAHPEGLPGQPACDVVPARLLPPVPRSE
jgi:outer membrane protein TolC